jgi:mono/diheme cytochrome c family protein
MSNTLFRMLVCWMAMSSAIAADSPTEIAKSPEFQRGGMLYVRHCLLCHMGAGQGQPGTYPPLAGSDFLMADASRAIRAICEGLSGAITVNGVNYENAMPAIVLDDQGVADVLTFVRNSWGNAGGPVPAETVAPVRATTRFPTYEELVLASGYPPLPKAPDGFIVREVTRLNGYPVRLASDDRSGPLLALTQDGDVLSVNVATGITTTLITGSGYADLSLGAPSTRGMTVGPDQHLYVTANQQNTNGPQVMDETSVFRSINPVNDLPLQLSVWYRTNYPFGVGPYNHGISDIAFGPDGFVYVASGSRTDGGEKGNIPGYSTKGETPITAGIWRIDPKTTPPTMEMYARGLRNVYGFDWDGNGELFSVSNGPDAHAPEEMDHVVRGGHYGFPYQFSDWTRKPYPYTPDLPAGTVVRLPLANYGPAAGGSAGAPLFTFDAHSSPAGMAWLDEKWPPGFQNCFVITRFGNLLALNQDVGFDVLLARLAKNADGEYSVHTDTLLAPLGRPIDVYVHRGGIYIAEYTRPTNLKNGLGWLPGRIIELKPKWTGQTTDR